MKRLLTYLLIVLGLGLVLTNSVSAELTAQAKHVNGSQIYSFSVKDDKVNEVGLLYVQTKAINKCKKKDPFAKINPEGCLLYFSGFKNVWKTKLAGYHKDQELYIKWEEQSGKEKGVLKIIQTDTNKIFRSNIVVKSYSTYVNAYDQAWEMCFNWSRGKKINKWGCKLYPLTLYDKTQIAKKEPTIKPKKKVAKTTQEEFKIVRAKGKFKHLGDKSENQSCKIAEERARKNAITQAFGETISLNEITFNGSIQTLKILSKDYYKEKDIFNCEVQIEAKIIKDIKTQIAKKEPSQTQEVVSVNAKVSELKIIPKLTFYMEKGFKESYGGYPSSFILNGENPRNMGFFSLEKREKTKANYIQITPKKYNKLPSGISKGWSICWNKKKKLFFETSKNCSNISKNWIKLKFDGNNYYYLTDQTQIAKTEPTIKPEDKPVEVAKTTQEEFKPEDKDIDNDAPVIEIAEAITVDSQAYTLKGKVKDKSKIYLTIDGRQVQVKKGKFKVDRFNIDPDEVEEIKIVAIDKWNNKTEKTIKVTIDLKSTELVRSFEDLKPNSVKVKTDKNKIAIIIGIEKYENLINLDAKYANRDAKAFRTYATKALGVKESNIKILVDDKATRSQTLKAFKLWLPRIAGDGGKDIHIFFAGHGLASDDGEDLYILPQDGESSLLEDTAISRVELISLVQKVNPKSVTMFFDTCYSGQTRDERMLVASLRPIRIVADEQDTPNNFTIFTASNYDQTSGSIEETKHGMFSYYLMKGLEGKADTNRDKKITNGELIAYLKTNVSKEAFTQNREQDPMLSGDPDQVLMSYR